MTIVCDIDDVLNDLAQKAVDLYNTRSGKHLLVSDITSYNFYDCLPQEDADALCALFQEKELRLRLFTNFSILLTASFKCSREYA